MHIKNYLVTRREYCATVHPGSALALTVREDSPMSDSETNNEKGTSASDRGGAQTQPQTTPRRPQIGDKMPAPTPTVDSNASGGQNRPSGSSNQKPDQSPRQGDGPPRRRRKRSRGGGAGGNGTSQGASQGSKDRDANQQSGTGQSTQQSNKQSGGQRNDNQRGGQPGGQGAGQGGGQRSQRSKSQRQRRGQGQSQQGTTQQPVEAILSDERSGDDAPPRSRRGRQQRSKSKALGRYQMNVHVQGGSTQIAVLEGRSLVEHYVSRPADDVTQIHGNIYVGRVENVLPGMEAAFIDIGTPKNAVLYRGDVRYDKEDLLKPNEQPRIEDMLKSSQLILCQVTKNPIAHKGARLTQEVSLPGRFVVLVPNSEVYGISKRLPDDERKRLRQVLDRVKPAEHGVIVRTAAEGVSRDDIERDLARLLKQWDQINALAKDHHGPGLIYREPEMAVRFIREEFSREYRAVIIDDKQLYNDVHEYVMAVAPDLEERVRYYDPNTESLPIFERYHVSEQLVKAVDRKVWLPSGGSLIIEATEALTVIDVNTGRNVGSSSLEETVFKNNVEAAEEIARQLRLRDIGGIIVIDFIDMEAKENRDQVMRVFRDALSRDKTRTQVFNISDLGLVEMTRKRIGEGLIESMADHCDTCEGRGFSIPKSMLANS